MDRIEIFEAELKLMNKIWSDGSIKAIDLANYATQKYGWKKNTTYSFLRKMLEKGIIERQYPSYTITPLVTKEQVTIWKLQEVADILYRGNTDLLVNSSGFKRFIERD